MNSSVAMVIAHDSINKHERRYNDKTIIKAIKMTTDEEKSKISKLLQEIEVPEVKLTERCSDLMKEFHKRFDKEVETEMMQENVPNEEANENPYRPDPQLLEENEKKLRQLLSESKRTKEQITVNTVLTNQDCKRPWRTNSNKEKLLRIDGELKRHIEKSSKLVTPLADDVMQNLVKVCREETNVAPPVGATRLKATVDAAKKSLPNFQYKKIENTTATAIMSEAHDFTSDGAQAH